MGAAIGIVPIFVWMVFRGIGVALGFIAAFGHIHDCQRLGLLVGAVLVGLCSAIPFGSVVVNVVGLPGVGAMVTD